MVWDDRGVSEVGEWCERCLAADATVALMTLLDLVWYFFMRSFAWRGSPPPLEPGWKAPVTDGMASNQRQKKESYEVQL